MPKAKSKAQAKFFGAIAGGAKKSGVSKEEAKKRLKGLNLKDLPKKAKKK